MATLAPGLARKVKKILDTRTESPEVLGALSTLSSFYTENTAASRRRLRATIEKQGLGINKEFLAAAESVIQALEVVQKDLDGLSAGCRSINSELASSKAATADMLAEKEKLQRDLAVSETRSQLVGKFLQQYQLSEREVTALQDDEIGEDFFAALERVRVIHANCRSLLRTHHQRAGLELMDAMSAYQETAYERLCRWVQGECRGLGDMDAPEVDPLLQKAAEALRERHVLFKYCAEEVATARHNALFQRFIGALTRGGPGGMPRPIEMHAHDPRRFIGDMLAWVHQSLASERELLVSLFGDDKGRMAGSSLGSAASQELTSPRGPASPHRAFAASGELGVGTDAPDTAMLLDRVFESICRPLKVRIEQVLMGSPQLLLCYKVSQLLGFYTSTVEHLLGGRAHLTQTLAGCRQLASRVFHEQLKARGDKLLRYPPAPPPDLSPPQQLSENVHQLLEIVSSFESAFEARDGSSGEEEFAPVLASAVDPLIEMCERSAEALSADSPSRVDEGSRIDPSSHRIYLVNCLVALQGALSGHACCAGRAGMLGEVLQGHLSSLVGGEVGAILANCGLAEIVERVRLYQGGKSSEGAVMAADPALPLQRIADAMRAFFNLLSQPDAIPEFQHLQVPRVKADVALRVARSLADAYEAVYQAVADPQNRYAAIPASADAIKHTPAQVRTILGAI